MILELITAQVWFYCSLRLLPVFSTLAEEIWEDVDQLQLEADFPPFYDEPPSLPQQNTITSKPDNVLLTWLLLFLLRLQAKHYIPDSAVNCLLKFLYMFFSIVGRHSDFVSSLAGSFPMSVYQMQKFFWDQGRVCSLHCLPKMLQCL